MKKEQITTTYGQLANWSKRIDQALFVLLENESYSGLMNEVLNDLKEEHEGLFQFIKIKGDEAKAIQQEVSFSKLPALLIFSKGTLVAIYQGLVAKHEITEFLSKI